MFTVDHCTVYKSFVRTDIKGIGEGFNNKNTKKISTFLG